MLMLESDSREVAAALSPAWSFYDVGFLYFCHRNRHIKSAVLALMLRTYACIRVGESERKFDPAVFQIDLVQSQLLRNGSDGLFA